VTHHSRCVSTNRRLASAHPFEVCAHAENCAKQLLNRTSSGRLAMLLGPRGESLDVAKTPVVPQTALAEESGSIQHP